EEGGASDHEYGEVANGDGEFLCAACVRKGWGGEILGEAKLTKTRTPTSPGGNWRRLRLRENACESAKTQATAGRIRRTFTPSAARIARTDARIFHPRQPALGASRAR